MYSALPFNLAICLCVFTVGVTYVESCSRKNVLMPDFPIKAIAVLNGEFNGSIVTGTVTFLQNGETEDVKVTVNLNGFPMNVTAKHGFHIHATGISVVSTNLTVVCGSTGPHYNPTNNTHGDIAQSSSNRHVGDLGNLETNLNGTITKTFVDNVLNLYGPQTVVGRAMVLHAKQDDLGVNSDSGSKSTGNSGARIACGVIGFA